MHTLKRILFCLCLVLAWNGTNGASKYLLKKPECNDKYIRRTDLAIAKLLGFGLNGRNFPETQQQLKGYCKETNQLVEKIDTFFKTCYKKEVRDMANVLIYSIKNNVRQFCRKKTKKLTRLLEGTPCINKHFIKNDKCLVLYANNTKQLINWKGDDHVKINHACCFYITSLKCSEDILDQHACIRNNKELFLDFVRGIFGSFVDFMCGEYNESTTRCDEIGPAPKPKVPNRTNYSSALMDIVEEHKLYTGAHEVENSPVDSRRLIIYDYPDTLDENGIYNVLEHIECPPTNILLLGDSEGHGGLDANYLVKARTPSVAIVEFASKQIVDNAFYTIMRHYADFFQVQYAYRGKSNDETQLLSKGSQSEDTSSDNALSQEQVL